MSQILLREFEHGSETKANGAINGHRVGGKARDARGRFQRTETVRADARKVGSRDRCKRAHANKRRSGHGKTWRFPARGWFTGETRDRFLIVLLLGVPAFDMGAAFMRGLLG